jgi:hypothetical protein
MEAPKLNGGRLMKKTSAKQRLWRYDIDYLVWNQPCACYTQKRMTVTSSDRLTEGGVLEAVKGHTRIEWGTDDAKAIGWKISPHPLKKVPNA